MAEAAPEAECIGHPVVAEGLDFAPLSTVDVQERGPAPLWPIALPERVVEVRNTSWGSLALFQALELAAFLSIPWSEPRRWLRELPYSLPWLLAFAGSLAWAWWLAVTCAQDPGYLAPVLAGPEAAGEKAADGAVDDAESQRRKPEEAAEGAEAEDPERQRSSPEAAPRTGREELEAGAAGGEIEVPLHWCETCHLLQPRRTKHCKECGYCVRTLDHHCFWLGGCIGEFNYRHFVYMLAVWTVVLVWHERLLLTCGDRRVSDPITWCLRSWYAVLLLLGNLMHLGLVGGLLVYHAYLIATAQTTWEHLSREDIDYLRAFPRTVFPFSRGSCANFKAFTQRGRGSPPQEWRFTWRPGQPVPFNIFENKYWSCC
mmetsp:Transcript_88656/g.275620  ORF Transcript_88656/g.275620 Transcript_88656/m.275620 type:complete len:372 (+) Transcript_88656:156-1271(+)